MKKARLFAILGLIITATSSALLISMGYRTDATGTSASTSELVLLWGGLLTGLTMTVTAMMALARAKKA